MEEEYDVIVLGTGLTECIISGLLSVEKKKALEKTALVLHMDRNNYYGGESASYSLNQLWEKFRPGEPVPTNLGRNNEYNVDAVPKFIMANGKLVQMLVATDVVKYLQFKAVDGSYVMHKDKKIYKVPANDVEALKSPLMGLFEKRRARGFFIFVQDYSEKDPKTWQGLGDLRTIPMKAVYDKFGLDEGTTDFIGHSLALHRDDSYINKPAYETVMAIKLYAESLARFGGNSPYIYPLYGLGELPQAFARLSAVYGGTYMLSKADAQVVYDESGAAVGVASEGVTAKAKMVVGDPSYFPGKTRKTKEVVRAMCIMSHPIPNTDDAHSAQIIIPYKQTGRKTDIYVFCCSYSHNVVGKNKWVAFVSTVKESANPLQDVQAGLALLGPVEHQFISVSEIFEPLEDGSKDKCFISAGYDETSHFEGNDVLALYKRITGKELDLSGMDPSKATEQQ